MTDPQPAGQLTPDERAKREAIRRAAELLARIRIKRKSA